MYESSNTSIEAVETKKGDFIATEVALSTADVDRDTQSDCEVEEIPNNLHHSDPQENQQPPDPPPLRHVNWGHTSHIDGAAPHCLHSVDFSQISRRGSRGTANNFLRGCVWSPDGLCIATNSIDNMLRLFNTPQRLFRFYQRDYDDNDDDVDRDDVNAASTTTAAMNNLSVALEMPHNNLIYDFAWLPSMTSADPQTCLLATTQRFGHIQMFDAFTGEVRARFIPQDHMEVPVSANSIAFKYDGRRLIGGFNRCIRTFHTDCPGFESERRPELGQKAEQNGIISSLSWSRANPEMFAAGSFNSSVALYDESVECAIAVVWTCDSLITPQNRAPPPRGVTHVEFSPDGLLLAAGLRNSPDLLVWDIRRLKTPITYAQLNRQVCTNQKIPFRFDASGRYLVSGSTNGVVHCWDLYSSDAAADSAAAPTVISQPTESSVQSKLEQQQQQEERQSILQPISSWQTRTPILNTDKTGTATANQNGGNGIGGLDLHPFLPILATASGQRNRRTSPSFSRAKRRRKKISNDHISLEIDSNSNNTTSATNQNAKLDKNPETFTSSSSSEEEKETSDNFPELQLEKHKRALKFWLFKHHPPHYPTT